MGENLNQSMRFKRILAGLSASLLLAAMLPMSVSALLLSEISQGKVLGSVTYNTVLISSPKNTNVKITAQAQAYDGTNWSYQLCWTRTAAAQGSVYVFPVANSSNKVLSVDNANQQDCSYFTAAPLNIYRIQYYSQPSAGGTLWLSKLFKAKGPVSNITPLENINPNPNPNPQPLTNLTPASGSPLTNTSSFSYNIAQYTPGYNVANQASYYAAELAANNQDFLETLVYKNPSGQCFFYNATSGSPVNTAITCPPFIVPTVNGNPSQLSPYDTSLYGATCTAMHLHVASSNGGAATKQVSPITCGSANGLPTQYGTPPNLNGQPLGTTFQSLQTNNPATYTPGFNPTANPSASYAAEVSSHSADFLETLVYADSTGACHFYNDTGVTPVITSIPCPNYIVPVVPGDPSRLSPYDTSLYGATCTAMHWHAPNANGGAANAQVAPAICGTANGVPSQYLTPPNLNGQPLGTTYQQLQQKSPSTFTPGFDPTANPTASYAAEVSSHSADFLETLVYADSTGACHFYNDTGVTPIVTSIPCPNYIVPVVNGNPALLSPYDTSLYGATCTAMHWHAPNANGGAANAQVSPIVCGTANGLPSQYNTPPNLNGQPLGTTYQNMQQNRPSTYTPGFDPYANPSSYYAAELAAHNSDFLETLVYADPSGTCHFYNDTGATPVISTIACPPYKVPTVYVDPSRLSPYDTSLYGATCTAQHYHAPGADGGAANAQLAPIICGTANGIPQQSPNQNGTPLYSSNNTGTSGAVACYNSSACSAGKLCFNATPNSPGTCQ